ncbi:MAG: ATP-binding cassette domain-containing protein [Thermodesulfobacteriota bacterium]
MEPLVELTDVTYTNDAGRLIFDRAHLSLAPGEILLVTAPVGSGKGVLLKLISGLLAPEGGAVRLFGEGVAGISPSAFNGLKKRMGFVFQDTVLVSNLKVIENVALPMLYHTNTPPEECLELASELLGATGFKGDLWGLPDLLGFHDRKRVAVARALSMDPEVLVCESIGAGLTAFEKEVLASLILGFHACGPSRGLLFTSTSAADAPVFKACRVVRIEGGVFVEKGGVR